MGIHHFSGLFVLLCLGLGSALLSSLGEHVFYHLALPRIRRGNRLQYWLHTSQRIHRALNAEPPKEQEPEPEPRDPEETRRDMLAAPAGPGSWTRVHQVVARERHVRFLLEPVVAADPPDVDVDEARPPGDPIRLCPNGRLPTELTSEGPHPGELEELEELERHIEGARERLRQALVRHRELLAQLGVSAGEQPCHPLQACVESSGAAQ